MPSCVIRGCVSSSKKREPSVILHSFPKEPKRIKFWLLQTGQYGTDIDKMVEKVYLGKLYDSYRMCSLHFSHDSYRYDGDRRILKKDATPTVFKNKSPSTSSTIPSVSGPSDVSGGQCIPSAPPSDGKKPSCLDIVSSCQTKLPVIQPKLSSEPTIQQVTLVPVVPQNVFFEARTIKHKSSGNSVVGDRSTTIQPNGTTMSEFTQKHSVLSFGNQQLSVMRLPTSSILNVPVSSSSSCVQQSTSTISEFTASFNGKQMKQLTPANLEQSIWPKATYLSTKIPNSTTYSCPIISSSPAPNPVILASGIDNSSYKTLTTPQSSIALSIVREAKPYSRIVLPVSGNVFSVTQTPPYTSSSAQKPSPMSVVHIPLKTPTSQTIVPDCLPPSKKRKCEGNVVFLEPSAVSSYGSSVLPFIQPSCLIQKPLMVDKGVNTDSFTNGKCCCVATDPMNMRRNAHTQTKIYRKHRKIMCTLLVSSKETDDLEKAVSGVSPEDCSDCSLPSSSDNEYDSCEDSETINLDLVKAKILPDSIVDASEHTALDIKQEFYIKEEEYLSLKIEPYVKTEEDQFLITSSSQEITPFESQNAKIERISPIPCEPFAPVHRTPTSWETSAIKTEDESEDTNDSSFYINEVSEDEDESFLVPSDAEDEDDVKHVFQDLDSPVENLVEEEKYIVFESCLKKLIMMIPCRSETKCMSPLTQYRKETVGSYLSVEARCSFGHTSLLWESQPRHGYEPLGNVLLSAAVLFSGSSFVKSQHLFKLLNLKSIDKTTYCRNQSMYLFPTINHHWKEEQKAVIQSVQVRPLCLAGDQQLDNPGFSANYSIYSLMDVTSKKMCSFSVEQVTPQVTLEGLEKKGFQKAMGELQTMNANVKMIVSDRNIAIQEILKDSYPGIIHQLDLWHLSRSIGNEVLMAARHKDCEILYQWVEAIRNHLWWSLCTCCKNPDLLIQKWKSVIHHVANVHEWDGDSDCRACHHPPLPEEVVNNTNWLEKGSAAHEQLKKIVESTSLLNDLKQLSFHCHTGELDIYHRTCLKYRPKNVYFFIDSVVARTQLAALDHNRNIHMVKTVVNNASSAEALGSMTQRLEVSKGQKSWIMKALYKSSCQSFLFDIINDVITLVREEKTLW